MDRPGEETPEPRLHEVPHDPRDLFRKHDNALAGDLMEYLEANRGHFTLEQCLFLFRKINRLTGPLRHHDEPVKGAEALVRLIIFLDGHNSVRGALDSISEFVKAFGSEQAQEEFSDQPKTISRPVESVTKENRGIRAALSHLLNHFI